MEPFHGLRACCFRQKGQLIQVFMHLGFRLFLMYQAYQNCAFVFGYYLVFFYQSIFRIFAKLMNYRRVRHETKFSYIYASPQQNLHQCVKHSC